MKENRIGMKVVRALAFGFVLVSIIGCGGAGSATSPLVGNYDGTVVNPGKTSQTVEITVNGDGTITGKCTLLSLTSGAIMARATLTGTANPTTREFVAAGGYQSFIPPPPDGSGTGPVTITGSLPAKNSGNGTMQVQDSLTVLLGTIAPTLL